MRPAGTMTMMKTLKNLFDCLLPPLPGSDPATEAHAVRLAAAALPVEVMRADAGFHPDGRAAVLAALRDEFKLSGDEAAQSTVDLAARRSAACAARRVYECANARTRHCRARLTAPRRPDLWWRIAQTPRCGELYTPNSAAKVAA